MHGLHLLLGRCEYDQQQRDGNDCVDQRGHHVAVAVCDLCTLTGKSQCQTGGQGVDDDHAEVHTDVARGVDLVALVGILGHNTGQCCIGDVYQSVQHTGDDVSNCRPDCACGAAAAERIGKGQHGEELQERTAKRDIRTETSELAASTLCDGTHHDNRYNRRCQTDDIRVVDRQIAAHECPHELRRQITEAVADHRQLRGHFFSISELPFKCFLSLRASSIEISFGCIQYIVFVHNPLPSHFHFFALFLQIRRKKKQRATMAFICCTLPERLNILFCLCCRSNLAKISQNRGKYELA